MRARQALEIDDVEAALDAARQEAIENGWTTVSIAVVDDGGHLLGFLRLTDAPPLTAQVSVGKARAAALSRRESGFHEEMIRNGRNAFLSVAEVASVVLLEGGVPIIADGICLGAIGVSGVRSDQDARIATAGVNRILTPGHPAST